MKEILKKLKEFTKDCREDMHEPDEQGIDAYIIGDHLDNAHGESINADQLERGYHEYVVILKNEDNFLKDKPVSMKINLATLIALARKAKL